MSRIGKNPVKLPEKVTVKVNESHLTVKGPLGQLDYQFTNFVNIEQKDDVVVINPSDDSKQARALWGTTRAIISNMVIGVSKGFTKVLEINGVGYKAAVSGTKVTLNLGYSHPIDYNLPEGVKAKMLGKNLEISGTNKEVIGLVAAKIRSFRPPEPYKGKGVRYSGEHIIRKAGKTGAKA